MASAAKGKKGLLLVLDEAQKIADLKWHIAAETTLDLIHNGEIGHPVILLAGGLGRTIEAFASLGISRFARGSHIELGRLDTDSSCRVIRDWIIKSGRARGDVTVWVEVIARETDDWPHHIINFAAPAARWLHENGGKLTDAGLNHVLAAGRQGKADYYQQRAAALGYKDQALLGAMIQIFGKQRRWDRDDLMEVFGRLKRAPGKTAGNVIDLALAKGVLAGYDDFYHVPIPSMEDWLIGRFESPCQARPAIRRTINKAVRPMLQPSGIGSSESLHGDDSL